MSIYVMCRRIRPPPGIKNRQSAALRKCFVENKKALGVETSGALTIKLLMKIQIEEGARLRGNHPVFKTNIVIKILNDTKLEQKIPKLQYPAN